MAVICGCGTAGSHLCEPDYESSVCFAAKLPVERFRYLLFPVLFCCFSSCLSLILAPPFSSVRSRPLLLHNLSLNSKNNFFIFFTDCLSAHSISDNVEDSSGNGGSGYDTNTTTTSPLSPTPSSPELMSPTIVTHSSTFLSPSLTFTLASTTPTNFTLTSTTPTVTITLVTSTPTSPGGGFDLERSLLIYGLVPILAIVVLCVFCLGLVSSLLYVTFPSIFRPPYLWLPISFLLSYTCFFLCLSLPLICTFLAMYML